jgi:hypothetical protein
MSRSLPVRPVRALGLAPRRRRGHAPAGAPAPDRATPSAGTTATSTPKRGWARDMHGRADQPVQQVHSAQDDQVAQRAERRLCVLARGEATSRSVTSWGTVIIAVEWVSRENRGRRVRRQRLTVRVIDLAERAPGAAGAGCPGLLARRAVRRWLLPRWPGCNGPAAPGVTRLRVRSRAEPGPSPGAGALWCARSYRQPGEGRGQQTEGRGGNDHARDRKSRPGPAGGRART